MINYKDDMKYKKVPIKQYYKEDKSLDTDRLIGKNIVYNKKLWFAGQKPTVTTSYIEDFEIIDDIPMIKFMEDSYWVEWHDVDVKFVYEEDEPVKEQQLLLEDWIKKYNPLKHSLQ